MSEPVLERSVLERKERDELQTIARAMGASPPSRARKADLVDLILTSAGINPAAPASEAGDAAEAAPKPRRRTRASRPSAPPADEDPAAAKPDDASTNEPVAGIGADATGAGGAAAPAETDPASADASVDADETDEVAADEVATDDADETDENATDRADASAETGVDVDADADAGEGARTADRDDAGGRTRPRGGRPDGRDNGGDRTGRGGDDGNRAVASGPQGGERPGRDDGTRADRDRDRNRSGGQGAPTKPGAEPDKQRNGGPDAQREGADDGGPRGEGAGDDGDAGNRRRRRRGRERGPGTQPDDAFAGEPVEVAGLLDLRDEGYGFLRTKGYLPSRDDVYVSVKQVRQFGLRKGDTVRGASRPASRNEKNPALLRIDQVNGKDPELARRRARFEDLTPLFPDERLRLETPDDPSNMTARIVDLVAPIGKGQRGLVVSPPKAGKTTVLKQIVRSIEKNNPDVHLIVLLVDERPEEVTDMRRSTSGEVVASTFDRPAEEHTSVSELVIERAKRLVEDGDDVVVVLDGITRLARAYNLSAPPTGRIMSGGVDSGALYPPKRFFGAARNIEEGGSLTILATALIETGSKMDEVIFEEFKGTGNMELRLDRRLAERRIYPAIDVDGSSTRHEELLFDQRQLPQVWRVRRAMHALTHEGASPSAALERLMDGMRTFASNAEFLDEAAKAGGPAAG